jgi:hypothetical protein
LLLYLSFAYLLCSPVGCFAAVSEKTTLRVNNIPAYWEACRLMMARQLMTDTAAAATPPVLDPTARVAEKSQVLIALFFLYHHCTFGQYSTVFVSSKA